MSNANDTTQEKSKWPTLVQFFNKNRDPSPSSCGYCEGRANGINSSISHGMWSYHMSTTAYQKLIDLGWRRSGQYLYKPSMDKTCCPQYTIRQPCQKFKISKSQKKCLRKMTQYLKLEFSFQDGQDWQKTIENHFRYSVLSSEERQTLIDKIPKKKQKNKNGSKLVSKNDDDKNCENGLPKLTTRLVKIDNSDLLYKKTKAESFKIYKKYQMKIHNDKESKLTVKQWAEFLCAPPNDFVHDSKSEASGKFEYFEQNLEKNNDNLENCIPEQDSNSNPKIWNSGAYHLQYLLDDKIIAVSVIDILDHCVSSVYLYYDTDFEFLSLGTYTALYEILLCQKFKIPYYYLGYYIHDCTKMKYKANYRPSELLCPVSKNFVAFTEEIGKKLDLKKFCLLDTNFSINGNSTEESREASKIERKMKEMQILFNGENMTLGLMKMIYPKKYHPENFDIYFDLVGKELAEEFIRVYVPIQR